MPKRGREIVRNKRRPWRNPPVKQWQRQNVSLPRRAVVGTRFESTRRVTLNALMRLAAIFEAATGAALLINPAAVTFWLLDWEASGIATAVCRVAGVALVALAVACWPPRPTPSATTTWAMFIYTLVVGLYLAYLGIVQSAGTLLWPAVAAHVLLAMFFIRAWSRDHHRIVA